MFVGKITVLSLLVFCGNIFARPEREYVREYEREDIVTSCDDTLNVEFQEIIRDPDPWHATFLNTEDPNFSRDKRIFKKENIRIHVNDDKERAKLIVKTITCKDFREKIVEIYNKKDSLVFSKHYKWKGKMLLQTIDDGIVRNIVPGETCCDFKVIEPSGDTVSFHLNPQEKLDTLIKIRNDFDLVSYMMNYPNHPRYERVKYDAIIYSWYFHCEKYYETEKLLKSAGRPRLNIEEDISPSHTSSYKYYAIIAVCIAVASIAIIRKRRRAEK